MPLASESEMPQEEHSSMNSPGCAEVRVKDHPTTWRVPARIDAMMQTKRHPWNIRVARELEDKPPRKKTRNRIDLLHSPSARLHFALYPREL